MVNYSKPVHARIHTLLALQVFSSSAHAINVNNQFSINATFNGVYQYGFFQDNIDEAGRLVADKGRGNGGVDLELDFTPTEIDEFYVLLQYSADNGLNDIWMGPVVPNGHPLEDDLKNINGKSRDYITEAWYRHYFEFGENLGVGITGGILDSTIYVDDNEYANDELTQFMNNMFINDQVANPPSYDWGGLVEFDFGSWTLSSVAMFLKTGDDANRHFQYYVTQLRFGTESILGEGHYRILAYTTNKRFLNVSGDGFERLQGMGGSFDQQLGENLGIFFRAYRQKEDAAVDFQWDVSGGMNIIGNLWGRIDDEFAIGYGYIKGGNGDIQSIHVFETYYKFQINSFSSLTLDLQYMKDSLKQVDDRKVWIPGVRFIAYF